MHTPELVVGKTAVYYEKGVVPHVIRVMVTKSLGEDKYIVSEFDNPNQFYETIGWHFTLEKEKEQPEEPNHEKYLKAYEERA